MDMGAVLDGATGCQRVVNGYRGRIHRPVQHSYDDFGPSLGDCPSRSRPGSRKINSVATATNWV